MIITQADSTSANPMTDACSVGIWGVLSWGCSVLSEPLWVQFQCPGGLFWSLLQASDELPRQKKEFFSFICVFGTSLSAQLTNCYQDFVSFESIFPLISSQSFHGYVWIGICQMNVITIQLQRLSNTFCFPPPTQFFRFLGWATEGVSKIQPILTAALCQKA